MGKTIGVVLALKDKCSPQLKSIADKLGITEKEAKRVNSQVSKASKTIGQGMRNACIVGGVAIAGVVTATQQLVSRTVEAGDRIDKMSQKMQMSRQTFQELDYVFAQNGADIEMMQKGMVKLSKSVVDASKGGKSSVKMFKALGISVKDSNGHIRKSEDILLDTLSALQKMPDDANRAKIANDLLGKSASDLAPLINKGSKDLNMLRKQFKDLGMGMSDEAVDSAVIFGDTMDAIGRSMSAFGYSIGASVLPVLQSVADQLTVNLPRIKATVYPVIQGLGGVINFVINNFNTLIAVGSVVVSTFVAFQVINGVITTIQTLRAVIAAVSAAQGIWNALMLANPIGLIALGIGALVGVIVLLVQNWDKVTEAAHKAFGIMKKVIAMTPAGIAINAGKTLYDKAKGNEEKPKKHATGTSFSSGGQAIVGEHGRELVNLPKGASVTPAAKTQKLMNGGQNVTVNVTVQGNMVGNSEFLSQLANIFAVKMRTAMATV